MLSPRTGSGGSSAAAAAALALGVALAASACGHDATGPKTHTSSVRILAGAGVTDTVQAEPVQALVVEVKDSTGRRASGMVVRFEAARPTDPARQYESAMLVCALTAPSCGSQYVTSSFAVDTTTTEGRASVLVKLGTVAGPAKIYITVPELGQRDSAAYTVQPGAPAHVVFSVPDTMVRVGGTYAVKGTTSDRFFNPRSDAVTYSADGAVASVDATGVVKGLTIGRGVITATAGSFHASAAVSVVPAGHIAAYRSYGPSGLVELDLDGSGYRLMTATSGATSTFPTWSPDGSRLTYTEVTGSYGLQLLSVDAHGNTTNAVTDGSLSLSEEGQYSHDGSYLYFYGSGAAGCCLWRVDARTGGAAEFLSAAGSGSQPSPSPDGTRVAFNDYGSIDVLTLATNTVERLGVGGDFPRWAPSGEVIAFDNYGQLALVNADGSGERLLGAGFNAGVDWSPDGKWLIASRAGQLTLVRVSDGLALPLHTSGDALFTPIWKP